jgi:hypothetical protein
MCTTQDISWTKDTNGKVLSYTYKSSVPELAEKAINVAGNCNVAKVTQDASTNSGTVNPFGYHVDIGVFDYLVMINPVYPGCKIKGSLVGKTVMPYSSSISVVASIEVTYEALAPGQVNRKVGDMETKIEPEFLINLPYLRVQNPLYKETIKSTFTPNGPISSMPIIEMMQLK